MYHHACFSLSLLLVLAAAPSLSAQDEVATTPQNAEQAAEQPGADEPQGDGGGQANSQPDSSRGNDAAEEGDEKKEPAQKSEDEKSAGDKEDKEAEKKDLGKDEDDGKDAKDAAPADEKASGEEKPADEAEKSADKAETEEREKQKPEEPEVPRLPTLGYTDTPRLPGQPWRVHDLLRPRPQQIEPGEFGQPVGPPSDALVLFDGSDLSQWCHRTITENGDVELYAPQWSVGDGYFEVKPRSGPLQTLDSFGSCQLHIEWAVPEDVDGQSQQRGNSGIKLMGMFEVQVLDSYNNRTYADGQAAAIYGQYPPDVSAARRPGEWQTYDIIFEAPQFRDRELEQPAYITMLHNGVLVHHRRELLGVTKNKLLPEYEPVPPAGPLELQDHRDRVRYRNIWIRRID